MRQKLRWTRSGRYSLVSAARGACGRVVPASDGVAAARGGASARTRSINNGSARERLLDEAPRSMAHAAHAPNASARSAPSERQHEVAVGVPVAAVCAAPLSACAAADDAQAARRLYPDARS